MLESARLFKQELIMSVLDKRNSVYPYTPQLIVRGIHFMDMFS